MRSGPDGNGDGQFEAEPPPDSVRHVVNAANQVERVVLGPTVTNIDLLHDQAGNIVFDGVHYLQYDALNRLVQVNGAGTLTVYDFEVDPLGPRPGRIKAACVSKLGGLVARYTYDGLGRLIRKEAPDGRREDYYYDGVRRLQEDVTPPAPATAWTERQYVYGPEYVDEFVAQIDKGDAEHPAGHVFYMLQDANYNVVALVGLVGSTWQVVEQYTYEPYGAVVEVDDLAPGSHPVNRVGHQGLFYEHLDGGTGLTVGSVGLYYNRNRWYSPALGRFISRDPNETAMPIIAAMAINARAFLVLSEAFDAQGHYADGMNLYRYLGSNPINRRDPAGAFLLLDTTAAQSEALWLNFTATCGAMGVGFAGMATYGVLTGLSLKNAALQSAEIAAEFGVGSAAGEALFAFAEARYAAGAFRAAAGPGASAAERAVLRQMGSDAAFAMMRSEGERVLGYTIWGAKGLVGKIFVRSIAYIEGEGAFRALLSAFEQEAATAGASSLRLELQMITNQTWFRPGMWEALGYTYRVVNATTIEVIKRL